MKHSESVHYSGKCVFQHLQQMGSEAQRHQTPESQKFIHLTNVLVGISSQISFLAEMVKDVYDKLDRIEARLGTR